MLAQTEVRSPDIDFRSSPNTGHSVVHAGLPFVPSNRVFDLGATGQPDGRQRGDRAALERQASKQNRHHWR